MSQEAQSNQLKPSAANQFRAGPAEYIEAWGRSHGGLLAILGLVVAVATVSGLVFGAFADAWQWVYAREWATLALIAVLLAITVVSTYRTVKTRAAARKAIEEAVSSSPQGPYALEGLEAKERLTTELTALQGMAEAAGLNVTWQPDWRFRIRRSGGRNRNLLTLDLAQGPNETRAVLRTELRGCEQVLRDEGVRLSPALLRDP